MLEAGQTKLLFKEYENGRDGTLRLRPCTLVMLSKPDGKSVEQWKREAVILQAPEGADLKFDAPLNIGTGKIGNLESGQLRGKFTIRSDQRLPGPDDDLLIVSRDANLFNNRVTSLHPIEFRLGGSHGSGRDLRIELVPGEGASGGFSFRGIASIEMKRDVEMLIDVEGLRRDHPSQSKPSQPGAGRGNPLLSAGQGPQPPLRITCAGPFRFEMAKHVATFEERVDVLRLRPQGQSDHLQGELLSLFFTPIAGAGSESFPKLEASHIEVRGMPVVMRSTVDDLDARGEFLRYDIRTEAIRLEGKQPASVRRGASRIEAPKLLYEPSARSRYGHFSAVGPGKFDAASPNNPQQQYRAQWTQSAAFGPDQQQHVVALVGKAHFEQPTTGALWGDEVYVWLDERSAQPTNRPRAATALAADGLVPNRLLAQGTVRLESPQLSCNVDKLQAWFVPVPGVADPALEELPAPAQAARSAPFGRQAGVAAVAYRPAADRRSGQAGGPLQTSPRSRYFVQGKLLQVQLRLLPRVAAQVQAELSQLRVLEKVRVIEMISGTPSNKPLTLTGDQLDYEQTNNQDGKMVVVGQPAHVEARDATLDGPTIRLNRATSELDVDGAGRMRLPANRNFQGQALERTVPVNVTWQRQMHFDGRVAHLQNGVLAQFDGQTLHTDAMEVAFSKPINFANPPREGQPEVEEIICLGSVTFDRPSLEDGKLASVDHMQAATLKVNRITGGITAEGPGRMTSVRRGAIQLPVAGARTQQTAPGAEDRLTYLRVEFLTLATGNLNYRTMQFGNRVKAVFGPVAGWDDAVHEEDFDQIGADGRPIAKECGYLESQHMLVSQVKDADGKDCFELDASGNAKLEGINFQDQSFVAQGDHIKYEQAKDLVILQGDGSVDAVLEQQARVGAKPEYTSSRTIYFWLARADRPARVSVDGANHADLTTIGRPRQNSRPPQAGTLPFSAPQSGSRLPALTQPVPGGPRTTASLMQVEPDYNPAGLPSSGPNYYSGLGSPE